MKTLNTYSCRVAPIRILNGKVSFVITNPDIAQKIETAILEEIITCPFVEREIPTKGIILARKIDQKIRTESRISNAKKPNNALLFLDI